LSFEGWHRLLHRCRGTKHFKKRV